MYILIFLYVSMDLYFVYHIHSYNFIVDLVVCYSKIYLIIPMYN
ncbi:hypothetical protein FNU2_80 [Fusobacterium phage vB_FnuS_FNU2]|nr:hypothetical protein FNU2_80 [Fusobacterium phage vB_FnuS_FNU2]